MAQVIGSINTINGSFFIKSADGVISAAKVGDTINSGDVIIGSGSNNASNMLTVALNDNSKLISVLGDNQQLFDETMLGLELNSDTVVKNVELNESLLLDTATNNQPDAQQPNPDATLTLQEIEKLDAAAAGGETTPADGTSGVLLARLEDRTGAEVDINTDLRDTSDLGTSTAAQTAEIIEAAPLLDAVFSFLGNVTVLEGTGTATISASLDQTPTTPLVITLSNGATITFGTGYVPGTAVVSTPFPIQGDDVYVDGENYTISVSSTTGGGFASVDSSGTGTVTVSDTVDTTTVVLNQVTSGDENEYEITYTASLVDKDGNPVTLEAGKIVTVDLAITDPNGNSSTQTLTIGGTTGANSYTLTVTDLDPYVENEGVSAALVASSVSATEGNLEKVVVDTTAKTFTINDVTDTTTVVLNQVTSGDENEYEITYTASLVDKDGNPVTLEAGKIVTVDLAITDPNGNSSTQTLTIGGTTGANSYTLTVTDLDPYVENEGVSAALVASSVSATEGNLEKVVVDTTAKTFTINDVTDTTTVVLNQVTSGDENEYEITYTASLVDKDGNPVTLEAGKIVTVDLAITDPNGNSSTQTLTIGGTTGANSYTLTVTDLDPYVENEGVSAALVASSVSATEGNLEKVVVDTTAKTFTINDVTDTTTVVLNQVTSGDENEYEITYTASLVDKDGNPVTLEAGKIVTVDLAITDPNGNSSTQTLTIGGTTGANSYTLTVTDLDPYVENEGVSAALVASSVSATEGNLEKVVVDTTAKTFTINDVTDTTTVVLNQVTSGDENEYEITYTASLVDKDGNPVTLEAGKIVTVDLAITDPNGNSSTQTLTIGGTTGANSYTLTVTDLDPYVENEGVSAALVASSVSATEGNLEKVVVDTTAKTFTINDVTDTTTANITVSITDSATAVISVQMSSVPDPDTYNVNNKPLVYVKLNDSGDLIGIEIGADGKGSSAEIDISGLATPLTISYDSISENANYEKVEGIIDNIPVINVDDLYVHREVATTTGDINFAGGDVDSLIEFIKNDGKLTWVGMDENKFDFIGTESADGNSITYTATYAKDGATETYFTITVKNDGTYEFNLLQPAPTVSTPLDVLLNNIVMNSSGTEAYISNSTFDVVITGYRNGEQTTLQKNDFIGVAGNTINKIGDTMKFDINQKTGYENTTLSSFTIVTAADKASIKTSSTVYLTLYYTDGTSSSTPATGVITDNGNGTFNIDFDINTSKVLDYVILDPVDCGLKVSGISMEYTTVVDPSDIPLQFKLEGEDDDGDFASSTFDVTLMAGTSGDDTINTSSKNESVSGGDGNDTINVGDGNDHLYGGDGNDTLNGGNGNDYLDGGAGSDKLYGGTGDDTIVYDSQDISINGGAGNDILLLTASETIDFSSINDTIQSIEQIDLTASGSQSINNLSLADVMDLVPDESNILADNINLTDHILKITGDGSDSVNLTTDFTKLTAMVDGLHQNLTTTIDNVSYNIYTAEDSSYKVLIQTPIVDTTN